MSYSKKVQKAKATRSDHRKARAVAGSVNRTALKRDSKKFKSLEREHDQNQRFGGSLKAVYFDSDGDGYKDTYGRVYRSGVVGKPGAEIPTFNFDPPVSGPTGLLVSKILDKPASGPSELTARIIAPASGPTGLDTFIIAPVNGPSGLDASVNIPNAGPSGLDAVVNAPNAGPTGLDAIVNIPNNGPTGLDASAKAPASGPTGLIASEVFTAPTSGPTGLDASVNAPSSGPTGLDATVNAPASGPTGLDASVIVDPPFSGPTGLDAGITVPASGPTGLDAAKLTLNIEIVSDDSFAEDPNTGSAGEIIYSSDFENLYIHDGNRWHRANGG